MFMDVNYLGDFSVTNTVTCHATVTGHVTQGTVTTAVTKGLRLYGVPRVTLVVKPQFLSLSR